MAAYGALRWWRLHRADVAGIVVGVSGGVLTGEIVIHDHAET